MTNIIIEKVNTEYLHHEDILGFMKKELTIEEIKVIARLNYLDTFNKPSPSYCPECGGYLTSNEDDETFCTDCGLIVSMSVPYVAGVKIELPYGRH